MMRIAWLIIVKEFFLPLGTCYRWLFFLGRKPYKYFAAQSGYVNSAIGVIVTFLMLVALKYFRTKH